MRILLTIHHALDRNTGAAGVTWHLASALRDLGHEVRIFSWDDLPGGIGPRFKEALFPELAAGPMARSVRGGVDVIDASTGDAWVYLMLRSRRKSGRPAVITRGHGLEHTFRDARRAQAERDGTRLSLVERMYHDGVRLREVELSMRLADAAWFLNTSDRDRAVEQLGVAPERARIVANGIPDTFIGGPAPRAPASTQAVRIAQVGSWDERKGTRESVAALSSVLAPRPEVRASFLGTGVSESEVRSRFAPEVRGQVDVHPRYQREELPSMLRDHAVLLLPSLAEGFSLALLEGMACGLAPVASAVGAAPDVLSDGENGLLVAPGNGPELARALASLCDDHAALLALRRAAYATAQEYGWSTVAMATAEGYRQVIADKARVRPRPTPGPNRAA